MAAGAPMIEKVELRSEGELAKIEGLLAEAVDARLEAGEGLTEEDRAALRAASANLVEQLRQFVVFAEDGEGGTAAAAAAADPASTLRTQLHLQLTPGGGASVALRSPMLPPLSPPPADAEVAALEAEVNAASLRVAELRSSMQAQLQERLAAKLAACRPSAELEPMAAAAGEAEAGGEQQVAAASGEAQEALQQQDGSSAQAQLPATEQAGEQEGGCEQGAAPMESEAAAEEQPAGAALALSPQPEELQQRLAAAAGRMPALRARLEQAADRLQRVVAAVAADVSRPEPNTVEKAVLGKTPGRPGTAAKAAPGVDENELRVSPLLDKAVESGQISTRRRMGRDVQPVPYSQPE